MWTQCADDLLACACKGNSFFTRLQSPRHGRGQICYSGLHFVCCPIRYSGIETKNFVFCFIFRSAFTIFAHRISLLLKILIRMTSLTTSFPLLWRGNKRLRQTAVALILSCVCTLGAKAQAVTYKTFVYTSDELGSELSKLNDERDSSRGYLGDLFSAGAGAVKGIAGGYVSAFIDMGVNAIGSLLTKNSRHKKEWEEAVMKGLCRHRLLPDRRRSHGRYLLQAPCHRQCSRQR